MAEIDWDFAQKAARWTLEEFCGFIHPGDPSAQAKLDRLVRRAIDAGELPRRVFQHPRFHPGIYGETPQRKKDIIYVTPAEALAWAQSKGFTIPPELARMIAPPRPAGWPWGEHETGLLRHLAAAADRWWKNYDPSDPTTAPTNDEVEGWLIKERGVAQRTAKVMATILRPDNLPTGRRK